MSFVVVCRSLRLAGIACSDDVTCNVSCSVTQTAVSGLPHQWTMSFATISRAFVIVLIFNITCAIISVCERCFV